MLDHRVIEFAWSLPLGLRIRAGSGKWLVKELLSRYVPRTLTERPKTGFGIPIDSWLRGPLRDWAESLLDEARLRSEGVLNPAPIREKWMQHLGGRRNWAYWLWDVIVFQAWHEEHRRRPVGSGDHRKSAEHSTTASRPAPARRYGDVVMSRTSDS